MDMKKPTILRMSDIKEKSHEIQSLPPLGEPTAKSEMEKKIQMAREFGLKEIDIFENALKDFVSNTKDLVLFDGFAEGLKGMTEEFIIKRNLVPILKGEEIPDMPEENYAEVRLSIFSELISKYISD